MCTHQSEQGITCVLLCGTYFFSRIIPILTLPWTSLKANPMKTLPWRKIAFIAAGVVLAAFLVFYFTRTRSTKLYSAAVDPAFGEYISSYTAGVIGSGSTIRIVLAKDAVDSASVGQETNVKLFNFSPAAQGTSRWLDRRTLEFRPEARLISGQIYDVSFALSKLFDMPKGLSSFEYSFQVIPQNFELAIENVRPYTKTERNRQKN